MRKPGFWRRALIVLASIWIVIGGSFGWNHAYDDVDVKFKQCVTAIKSATDLQACRDARNSALAVPRGVAAAIIALGPLLVLWLVLYAFRRLGRWTKRGAQSRAPLKSEPGAG
jgi:hypothetical protein